MEVPDFDEYSGADSTSSWEDCSDDDDLEPNSKDSTACFSSYSWQDPPPSPTGLATLATGSLWGALMTSPALWTTHPNGWMSTLKRKTLPN
jgi:hypothetical protein